MDVIQNYKANLISSMSRIMENNANQLNVYPDKIEAGMRSILLKNQHALQKNCALLDAYSPLKVLSRGYSITKKECSVIKSIEDVQRDDIIQTRLQDGIILSRVEGKEEE